MDYRKCFIPNCTNDTKNSPNKIFVRIREDLREKWCCEAKVEYFKVFTMYCCEDHFDPKEDLKNYYQCRLMNEEPRLKATASLRNTPLSNKGSSEIIKLLSQKTCHMPIKRKLNEDFAIPTTSTHSSSPLKVHVATQCKIRTEDKSTNYSVRQAFSTTVTKLDAKSLKESSSAATSSLFDCTSEAEESTVLSPFCSKLQNRKRMLDIVFTKPKMYLGLPKQYVWLLDYIIKKNLYKIDKLCLIVTLFKIKLNDSLERISDQFELSRTKLTSMLLTGIELLANYFQHFIFSPELKKIKENLPLVFKIRYSNVQMIIDCFEIQIAKPSNPLKQAQTWSQYKNCNTVKYLIGCTPNGFISFISKGYGGRISDKAIVEKSNILSILKPNAVVLADRGFKEIESLLSLHHINLLRPPTVHKETKQTTMEALQSKVIASLRVHVERVIRRVREFSLLKPHSVVNYKYVPYLDEVVIIACGLINLQGEIIKNY